MVQRPIVLTGGMACIPGVIVAFEDRLSEALQRPVTAEAPPNHRTAAAVGGQRIAERLVENGAY